MWLTWMVEQSKGRVGTWLVVPNGGLGDGYVIIFGLTLRVNKKKTHTQIPFLFFLLRTLNTSPPLPFPSATSACCPIVLSQQTLHYFNMTVFDLLAKAAVCECVRRTLPRNSMRLYIQLAYSGTGLWLLGNIGKKISTTINSSNICTVMHDT